jgi:hypothetical protein
VRVGVEPLGVAREKRVRGDAAPSEGWYTSIDIPSTHGGGGCGGRTGSSEERNFGSLAGV